MVESRKWDWSKVADPLWMEPSEDAYYYVNQWKNKGYKCFLDLGCGRGRHSILFAKNGFDTYALDLSPEGIAILEKTSKESGLAIQMDIGDINRLPYDSEIFDCLLAYHVISHTDTAGIRTIVGEIYRVLRSGAEFLVTLCSKSSLSFASKEHERHDENTIIKTTEPEVGIPHFYTDLQGVRALFADFEIIRIRHIEDIFGNSSSCHYFVHGKKI